MPLSNFGIKPETLIPLQATVSIGLTKGAGIGVPLVVSQYTLYMPPLVTTTTVWDQRSACIPTAARKVRILWQSFWCQRASSHKVTWKGLGFRV